MNQLCRTGGNEHKHAEIRTHGISRQRTHAYTNTFSELDSKYSAPFGMCMEWTLDLICDNLPLRRPIHNKTYTHTHTHERRFEFNLNCRRPDDAHSAAADKCTNTYTLKYPPPLGPLHPFAPLRHQLSHIVGRCWSSPQISGL